MYTGKINQLSRIVDKKTCIKCKQLVELAEFSDGWRQGITSKTCKICKEKENGTVKRTRKAYAKKIRQCEPNQDICTRCTRMLDVSHFIQGRIICKTCDICRSKDLVYNSTKRGRKNNKTPGGECKRLKRCEEKIDSVIIPRVIMPRVIMPDENERLKGFKEKIDSITVPSAKLQSNDVKQMHSNDNIQQIYSFGDNIDQMFSFNDNIQQLLSFDDIQQILSVDDNIERVFSFDDNIQQIFSFDNYINDGYHYDNDNELSNGCAISCNY